MGKEAETLTTFNVAAVYIGTLVGAGFASGQEVLQFFSFFGLTGILALAAATVMFVFYGMIVLELGRRLKADSHREIMRYVGGPWLGSIVDAVITFFLFGALTAMAAGTGAVFTEQLGLSGVLGSLVMIAITLLTVLLGIQGLINAISFVVPVLLISVLGVSVATLLVTPPDFDAISRVIQPARAVVPYWPLAAVNYVSYNLVIGVPVLASLGLLAKHPGILRRGAVYGGLGLGIGALAINLALLANFPEVARYQIPMAYVVAQLSPVMRVVYIIALLTAIYSTAVGCLYGFVNRFTNHGRPAFTWWVIVTSVFAFGASQFGFTNLVRVLYPAVGYAGLLMLAGLLYGYLKERLVPQPAYKPKK